MKARLAVENIRFERNQNPLDSLNIGVEAQINNAISDGKYRLIFTSGEPSLKIGQTRDFRHDQTWKNIGRTWKFIDYLPVKDLMELVRVYGRTKFPGYTYK